MSSAIKVWQREGRELLLPLGVIAILLVLFTPIPPRLLDFLLLANFAVALLILLVTFDTAKPLSFSTFPSLLLMTTLFRLALNVSATRLILSKGDAGQVIAAVGGHMVAGNYIIGFVIFLILVVVQYVVVTSGAQRVAEVAARFTLDALPGKQMSIDADVNMGIIDQSVARQRRAELERESNFYGAMDGASKFVKGDAVAGIIIILINIIGGLAVGMLQRGMTWSDALAHYTLLTVGDGIVTQIPSLIIALAAGIIITRAATDARLAQELGRQLCAAPKLLMMVASVLLLLMWMPGLPLLAALFLGLLFSGLAWRSWLQQQALAVTTASAYAVANQVLNDTNTSTETVLNDDRVLYASTNTEAFELRLGHELADQLLLTNSGLALALDSWRQTFATEFGFVLPVLTFRRDEALSASVYQVFIRGAQVAQSELHMQCLLAINPGEVSASFVGLSCQEPSFGLPAIWLQPELRLPAQAAGYRVIDPTGVLLTHLSEVAKCFAADLLSRAETERLLASKRTAMGSLVAELIQHVLSYSDVQRVLQLLLREHVSIGNLESILEVLVDEGRRHKHAEDLVERVRERLGAGLYRHVLGDHGELHVITLSPELEVHLSALLEPQKVARLPAAQLQRLITSVEQESERLLAQKIKPVLLCAPLLRRLLRGFMARTLPNMPVLAMTEVSLQARICAAGMIELPELSSPEVL